jgi:hypothetical protein
VENRQDSPKKYEIWNHAQRTPLNGRRPKNHDNAASKHQPQIQGKIYRSGTEELELIVFGKAKKKKPEEKGGGDADEPPDEKPKTPRDPDSYRRPLPKREDITREEYHPPPSSCSCGKELTKKREKTF